MAQARAALQKYKDIMQAAEKIFEGDFEDVMDDEDLTPDIRVNGQPEARARMIVSD